MNISGSVRKTLATLCLTLFSLLPGVLHAQEPEATEETKIPVEEQVIGELLFDGTRLSDAINYLKEACPGFQAVVITKPTSPATDPVLPFMSVNNVKLRNVIQLLEIAVPGLTYDMIDDGDGSERITVFRVNFAEGEPENVLRIFPLRTILARSDDRKMALDETLSLLQATLEAIDGTESVSMKVHEGTETVLVRGTTEQVKAVEQAILALTPSAEEMHQVSFEKTSRVELERVSAQIHSLSEALPRIISVMEKLKQTSEATTKELSAIQERLNVLEKTVKAKE